MTERWCVIVPLRLEAAKTRLSSLPAPQRTALALAMAADVIDAARASTRVGQVRVVGDPAAQARLLPSFGGEVTFVEDPRVGLNEALVAAADGMGGAVAAVLGDLPCVTPDLLDEVLAAGTGRRSFVSDAEGIGTTMLMAPQASSLDPRFGERSRARHAESGAREISDPSPGRWARLRRDVDSEVSLWDARRLGVGPRTTAALRASGISTEPRTQ